MRILSWIFTVAAIGMIIGCFFHDDLIFFAFLLSVLAAWTDDWASDIELIDFLSSHKDERP